MQKSTMGLIVVAAVIAIVTFFIAPVVFPPMEMPPASLLPAFLFLSIWDAIAFGVGIALIIYLGLNYSKWPKQLRPSLLALFFLALWFSVLNWIHDGLHESGASPPNFALLAMVEYVFHFPWLIFSGILVLVVLRLQKTYQK